ncbi:hypothetical protein IQ255_28715 [Pleurocapsales cyanobacterium LEGE 10410]|nr:hypothetical protein [Pleurocapsales cyanobacterium LEGE 10410]
MKPFALYHQYDQPDCDPTLRRYDSGGQGCLRMVAKHHGRHYSMDSLRQKSGINREGVSLLGMSEDAVEIRFLTVEIKYAGITRTPTTFLNGYELPAAYRVRDLFALIPGLTDAFGKQNGLNTMKGISGSTKISEKQTNV